MTAEKSDAIRDLLEKGIKAQREGALDDALKIYEQVLEQDSALSEAHFLYSLVCLDLGRAGDCIEGLDRAVSLSPDMLDYRLVRSEILFQVAGRESEAREDLKIALSLGPKNPQVIGLTAMIALRDGDLEEAEKLYGRALMLMPGEENYQRGLADTLWKRMSALIEMAPENGWDKTDKDILRVLDLTGGHETAQSARGRFLLAWAESLGEEKVEDSIRLAERASRLPIEAELAERCQAIIEQKKEIRRKAKREVVKRWAIEQEKWQLDEPQDEVETRIVETIERRRTGMDQPDENELLKRLDAEIQEEFGGDEARAKFHYAFHPYLGYVQRPYVSGLNYFNNHGFSMRKPWRDYPFNGEGGDDFVIGIFGGSVANQFFTAQSHKLETLLGEWLAPTGREVTVLNFSQGGFAQPQALLAYNYFSAIGQKFHAVINIDGFNEAMGKRANQINGYHVSLPLSWMMNNLMLQFQTPSDDPDVLDFSGRLLMVQAEVAKLENQKESLLRNWKLKRAKARLARLRETTPVVEENRLTEPVVLPRTEPVDARIYASSSKASNALVSETVDLWKYSSLLLGRACMAAGIPYLHCLQPNQYFWNKTLTAEEEDRFYNHGSIEYFAIRQTYPEMQARGEELKEQGIDFLDMTDCLDQSPETLLIDSSCHFNKTGYSIMADAMEPNLKSMAEAIPRS